MQAIFLLPQQTKEAQNIGQSDIPRTQSEQKRGRTLSPDAKAKISEALRGKPRKPFTPEHRARIGKAKKGKPRSPETRAKISEALRGKPHKPFTPEQRAQISETLKGKPPSPETRAKISEAKKGKPHKPHSPETRVRISEAQQRRWSERRKQQTEQSVPRPPLH
jgi:hypothetical protein